MRVEFEVQIDTGALYDYMINRAYSGASGVMGTAAGALLLIIFGRTGKIFFLAAGLLLLACIPAALYLKVKRQMRSADFQKTVRYRLTEEGVEASGEKETGRFRWEEVEKAVSTGKSIILYTGRSGACIFPREDLKDHLIPAVEMISTHMPSEKVNIRM